MEHRYLSLLCPSGLGGGRNTEVQEPAPLHHAMLSEPNPGPQCPQRTHIPCILRARPDLAQVGVSGSWARAVIGHRSVSLPESGWDPLMIQ